jgi:hypothetical protein
MDDLILDRMQANRLNAFISPDATQDTLADAASAIDMMSLMLSCDAGGIKMASLWPIFHTIAAAIRYEQTTIELRLEPVHD